MLCAAPSFAITLVSAMPAARETDVGVEAAAGALAPTLSTLMMRPQFPRLHARPDQPAEADRRKQLQVEVFLPDLVGDGLERHRARGAGVVDEDIDPAKILHDLVVGRGNIGSFGDVANVIVNLMPVLGELLPRRLQVLRPRARIATFAPDPANRRATASPMPLLPPVTTATRSFIVISIFFFLLFVFEHD